MSWTDWIRRNTSADGARPSVRDVTFDAGPLRADKTTADALHWVDEEEDRVVARVDRATPDRALVSWTVEGVRSAARTAASLRQGGIVSVTFRTATGIPIAEVISKFTDGTGYLYEGAVMIRFADALYSLTLQAREHRATGTREAIATGLLIQLGELTLPAPVPGGSTPLEGWFRDPYDDTYAGPSLHTLSDDERLDPMFPAHPVSKVRGWFTAVEQTLSVSEDVRDQILDPPAEAFGSGEPGHRIRPHALGILYLQTGRPDLAERFLAEAVPLVAGEPNLGTPGAGQHLMLLGLSREMSGRTEDAVWAHEWAVRASVQAHGSEHPESVRARANLARSYAALGRHQEAEPLLRQVIPIFEAQENESELAVAVNALGLVRQSQDRHAEALVEFQRALTLFEKLKGPDYVECGTVLRNISRSAEATHDRVGSRRAMERAERIFTEQRQRRS